MTQVTALLFGKINIVILDRDLFLFYICPVKIKPLFLLIALLLGWTHTSNIDAVTAYTSDFQTTDNYTDGLQIEKNRQTDHSFPVFAIEKEVEEEEYSYPKKKASFTAQSAVIQHVENLSFWHSGAAAKVSTRSKLHKYIPEQLYLLEEQYLL